MKRKDEISSLFHDRLIGAEMEVPAEFWNQLQKDLLNENGNAVVRVPFFRHYGWVAAVLLSLLLFGTLSYYMLPDSKTESAKNLLAEEEPLIENALNNYLPFEKDLSPVLSVQNIIHNSGIEEDDDLVEVTFTIHSEVFGTTQSSATGGYAQTNNITTEKVSEQKIVEEESDIKPKKKGWEMTAVVGTVIPKNGYSAPLSLGVSIKKPITKKVALETGLHFTHYPREGIDDVNTLSIPLQADIVLAQNEKAALYATIGGVAEKVLGNSFKEDPVLLSANAGIGVTYQLSDRLSLYAEPEISYRFNQDGQTSYLRNEQRLGVELMGGLRMSF